MHGELNAEEWAVEEQIDVVGDQFAKVIEWK